jgi:hypothetical protein
LLHEQQTTNNSDFSVQGFDGKRDTLAAADAKRDLLMQCFSAMGA